MNQFVSLQEVMKVGILDENGRPTKQFLRWMEGIEKKQQAINLNGQINTTTAVQGRTDGLGTTLQNLDSSGVVTDAGVDLSRNYVNKTLEHLPDSNLRRALTPEQNNYLNVTSVVTPGQSGTARPTTYSASGTGSLSSPQNAYDSDPTTFASLVGRAVVVSGIETSEVFTVVGFVQPAAMSSTTLNVVSSFSTSGGEGIAEYSLDGGGTWTTIYDVTSDRAQATDSVVLLTSQNFSLVQVRFTSLGVLGVTNSTATLKVYDARIDFVLS